MRLAAIERSRERLRRGLLADPDRLQLGVDGVEDVEEVGETVSKSF